MPEDGPDVQQEEKQDEEEVAEMKEADSRTLRSESTDGTVTSEKCGGGHPTPEDEIGTRCHLVKSPEEAQHVVTCIFTISLAVPLSISAHKAWMSSRVELQRTASKTKEGFIPRMHRFYHMEYFLLPDDTEPRKLDLVLFGPVAKLFLEAESKVVKPWLENDQLWVSWNHSVEINVTNDFLMKLREHHIKLRLWDTKEKVCSKAKICKMKGTATHSDQANIDGDVKCMVLLQRAQSECHQPKPSYTKVRVAEVSTEKSAVSSTAGETKQLEQESAHDPTSAAITNSVQTPAKTEEFRSLSFFSISGSIASSLKEKAIQEAKSLKLKQHLAKPSVLTKVNLAKSAEPSDKKDSKALVLSTEKRKISRKSFTSFVEKRHGSRKTSIKDAASSAHAKKHGIALLQLDLMPLLSGERSVTSRMEEKSSKIVDAYLSFSVEESLMTERQKRELNPLIIRIHSAKCLPTTPVSIEVLESSCVPVYCKYRFHNSAPHQTQGRAHGTHVFFKDVNVILAGTIPPGELHEYLRGPPLEIEVHDRDKRMESIKIKPSLFGEEPGDSKISNVTAVTSRYLIQNPIKAKEEMWQPYGVAKISLTELLLGEKCLNICAPIHSCSVQGIAVCQGGNLCHNVKGAGSSQSAQLPMGHYISAESHLKVRVEISVPLNPEDEMDDTSTSSCPYGCIIYRFDYKNTSLLNYLLQEITEINAEAFQLDSYPLHIVQKSLNTLKLNSKLTPEEVSGLDIITGFHILDGSMHLVVLEGLKDKALKRMWNKTIDRLQESKTGRLNILYNSQLSFHQRLYLELEATLFHIHLYKPLSSIMKQPLLYLRDMIPSACFQALTRLDYICCSKKLREVFHLDLLPSAAMITTLSQEFGIPLAKDDFLLQQSPSVSQMRGFPSKRSHKGQDIDNHNEEYAVRKREMETQTPQDYIQANIENVNLLSKMVKKEALRTIRAFPSDGKSIFNYSSQTLNSAEIAKNLLRQEMAQEPSKRFAYSHDYLSGIFEPVDEDVVLKESMDKSKRKWMSSEGFVFPGFKSSFESNMHARMPDEARLQELTEKWRENFLHANTLKPVLDRDRWSWEHRKLDFELYKKPQHSFIPSDTSVAERPKDERCNTALKVHRCCPATELIASGPNASCQLARLQGLLKDKPLKLSLKMQPVSVVGVLDKIEESSSCRGFVPGPLDDHSLTVKGNCIPCQEREYNTFKMLKGADFRLICRKHSFCYKKWPPQTLHSKDKSLIPHEKQDPDI